MAQVHQRRARLRLQRRDAGVHQHIGRPGPCPTGQHGKGKQAPVRRLTRQGKMLADSVAGALLE